MNEQRLFDGHPGRARGSQPVRKHKRYARHAVLLGPCATLLMGACSAEPRAQPANREPVAAVAQALAGSCKAADGQGRCGQVATATVCGCDSACTGATCCVDKHVYCYVDQTSNLCPLVAQAQPLASPPRPESMSGSTSSRSPANLVLHGTDLGFTYRRGTQLVWMFGDTWAKNDNTPTGSICPWPPPWEDDAQATSSSSLPSTAQPFSVTCPECLPAANVCPTLTFATKAPADPTAFQPISLKRWDDASPPNMHMDMGWGKTPAAGFSTNSTTTTGIDYGIFVRPEAQNCFLLTPNSTDCKTERGCTGASCPANLGCYANVGLPATCKDPTSSQNTGTLAAPSRDTVAFYLEIGTRANGGTHYTSGASFLTNKFVNSTVRAVAAFNPNAATGNNYARGNHTLLMWGRAGYNGEGATGKAKVYLLHHPITGLVPNATTKKITWRPKFYTGSPGGIPQWSSDQKLAVPLFDNGTDDDSEMDIIGQMTVSYVAPLKRWVMLYSGDGPDFLDPPAGRRNDQLSRGAIHSRHAPNPWGPWTKATPIAVSVQAVGNLSCEPNGLPPHPKGPWEGAFANFFTTGFCHPGDQYRPNWTNFPIPGGCSAASVNYERGNLYAPNIIDDWTQDVTNGSQTWNRAAIYWNVSTWNPYQVILMKSVLRLPK